MAALKVFQIEPDQLVLGQPMIVRSPISGEIVKNNIVIGQFMKDDADPVAVVADLNEVWVAANVKEKDMSLLSSLKRWKYPWSRNQIRPSAVQSIISTKCWMKIRVR